MPGFPPEQGEGCRHFLGEDFYDLVGAEPGRLPADFLAYMADLGLEPWRWSSIGDPFTDGGARAQFRRLWRNILPRYRRPGSLVKQDPVETGFQYQKPMPGIHLIWVGPYRVIDPPVDRRVRGRAMVARVFQRPDGPNGARLLPRLPTTDESRLAAYMPAEMFVRAPYRDTDVGVFTREYYASLGALMRDTPAKTENAIQDWIDAIVEHIAGDLATIGIRGNAG